MPDDLFEDAPGKDAPMPDADKGDPADKESDGETFLINSEVCPDMQPGDTMTLRVIAAHGEEYEVKYMPQEKEESDSRDQPSVEESEPAPGGMMD
jgi:hypothetical protein